MLTLNTIPLKGVIGILAAITIIPFSHETCSSIANKKVNTLMVFSSVQVVGEKDGQLFNLVDSFYIHHHGKYIMYQIPEIFEYITLSMDSLGNFTDEKFTGPHIRFGYWVFRIGDSSGKKFDSLESKKCSRFNVDSLIYTKTSLKQGISLDSYQLIEKITDSAKNFFTEKYTPREKIDSSPDSSFLYFRTDWKNVNFSFAEKLDLQKKAKLYKFRVIYNPIPIGKYTFEVSRREIILELRRPVTNNPDHIIGLFEYFKSLRY